MIELQSGHVTVLVVVVDSWIQSVANSPLWSHTGQNNTAFDLSGGSVLEDDFVMSYRVVIGVRK